jgi:hypothetical protein
VKILHYTSIFDLYFNLWKRAYNNTRFLSLN